MTLQHLRSSTANKRPLPGSMSDGQLAINTNTSSPGLFFKDSTGALIKVGPVHVGSTAPNVSPAGGGQTGNTVGEQWLDTSGTNPVLKIWDGSAWQSEAGEFVNASGDTMTGSLTAPAFIPNGSTVPTNGVYLPSANTVAISTNGTGRLFVDSIGRVLVGTTSARNVGPFAGGFEGLQFAGTTSSARVSLSRWDASTADTGVTLAKSRGGTIGTNGIISNGDNIGRLEFTGDDGTAFNVAVRILAQVDGVPAGPSPGPASMPGRIVFSTTPSGSTTPQERLRITSDGKVGLGTSSPNSLLSVNAGDIALQTAASRSTELRLRRYDTGSVNGMAAIGLVGAGTNGFLGEINFYTGNSDFFDTTLVSRMKIDSQGRVGVGTTSPEGRLHVNGGPIVFNALNADGDAARQLRFNVDSQNYAHLSVPSGSGGALAFAVGTAGAATERARIDSSGRLLVGTSSSTAGAFSVQAREQLHGTSAEFSTKALFRWSNDVGQPTLNFNKSRGTSVGTRGVVQSADQLGYLSFEGDDGTNFIRAAGIYAEVDGTPGANDMPGRLVFSVTIDGQASPSEAMRITNARQIWIGTTTGTIGTANFGTVFFNNGYFNAAGNFNGTQELARWYGNAGSVRFMGDGDVENTNNSYGALSDIKLKENITDAGSQWSDIKALQVRKYNLKAETGYSTHTQLGLIAQEVELVSPGLVGESPDRDAEGNDLGTVTKSVNYSVLYMKAVKALQEAMERIETLEAKVAALESA